MGGSEQYGGQLATLRNEKGTGDLAVVEFLGSGLATWSEALALKPRRDSLQALLKASQR